MNISNLFFHILYCNSRRYNEPRRLQGKITRTLQHHELFLVTGGKGIFIVGKKEFPLQEGMLFYVGSGVFQSITIDPEDPVCFMSVHFSYGQVSFNDGNWTVSDDVPMLSLPAAQQLRDYYQVDDVFKKMVDSWDTKLPGYEFMTKTLLQQLLIAIYQNTRKQHQNYSTSLKVERIIAYMQQKINHRVTLAELSGLVELSPTYLSRTFKEITGYSIIAFFNKMKIDRAKEMILEGDKKIKDVAQTLGFADEFYFSRIFKKMEGVSPSEFHSKNVHVV